MKLDVQLLNTELLEIGKTRITLASLVTVLIVLLTTIFISRWARRFAERTLDERGSEARIAGTIASLVRYLVLVVGFGMAIGTLGIDLTALFAAGAIFAIGLGFAMQSIAQNFVAGVLLLVERSIKPGDIIEVDGRVMMVREMGIRASHVRSRDGEDIIIPNASLIQNQVKNFTMKDSNYRVRAKLRVRFSSDMRVVRSVLHSVGEKMAREWGNGERPQVLMVAFGESGLEWEVGVWIKDPWERMPALDALYDELWWALADAGVTLAYNQLDLHVDPGPTNTPHQPERSRA